MCVSVCVEMASIFGHCCQLQVHQDISPARVRITGPRVHFSERPNPNVREVGAQRTHHPLRCVGHKGLEIIKP